MAKLNFKVGSPVLDVTLELCIIQEIYDNGRGFKLKNIHKNSCCFGILYNQENIKEYSKYLNNVVYFEKICASQISELRDITQNNLKLLYNIRPTKRTAIYLSWLKWNILSNLDKSKVSCEIPFYSDTCSLCFKYFNVNSTDYGCRRSICPLILNGKPCGQDGSLWRNVFDSGFDSGSAQEFLTNAKILANKLKQLYDKEVNKTKWLKKSFRRIK